MQKDLGNKLHFIGIGGSGMLPLAEIALALGYQVFGSDQQDSPQVQKLRNAGARIFAEHNANQLDEGSTVIYSSAIQSNNPELAQARAHNMHVLHRSELLARFMENKKAITIAGTHGKTTSTALVGHMLTELGASPTIYCGGLLGDSQSSGILGTGEYFVAEADESDSSFLRYSPFISLITNIGEDHLDHFGSMTNVIESFRTYIRRTAKDGYAILGWDNRVLHELIEPSENIDILTFGKRIGCDVRLYEVTYRPFETEYVALVQRDRVRGVIKTIGEHNVINLLGALAVARALEINVQDAADTFQTFRGVARRLSLIFDSPEIKIFDDYAHNPEKISSCLRALRLAWPDRTLHVIFQAHRYSRTETLYNEIVASFAQANFVYVMPIYAAGEAPVVSLSVQGLARDIAKVSKVKAMSCVDNATVIDQVLTNLHKADIVISIGAGDVYKVTHGLKDHFTKSQGDRQAAQSAEPTKA